MVIDRKLSSLRAVPIIIAIVAGLLLLTDSAHAQQDRETIELWNASVLDTPSPKGTEKVTETGAVTNVSRPRLIVHRPKHPNGMSALVISGGGYARIELGKESTPTAIWLQSQGITAFELVYRLPGEGWRSPNVPFQDAQRAMRLIRSRSTSFGIDPQRIGIIGFSAGGHLAGIIATTPNVLRYPPIDEIDRISARPDFIALIYPVITMMPPFDRTRTRRELIGKNPSRAQQIAYSVDLHVDSNTPKTFIAQSLDDRVSSIENSRLMFQALRKVKVPVKLHVFQTGGHGWGLGAPDTEVSAWPSLFKTWVTRNGFTGI
jgi:acetyl esterase/lipase